MRSLSIDTAEPLDNMEEVCREFGSKYLNQVLLGFGGAFRKGIEEAKYDKFLILDSDGSHAPKSFSRICKKMTPSVDVVICSRYAKGGKNHDAFVSVLMSKTLNFVFRIALGLKASQPQKGADVEQKWDSQGTVSLERVSEGGALSVSHTTPANSGLS